MKNVYKLQVTIITSNKLQFLGRDKTEELVKAINTVLELDSALFCDLTLVDVTGYKSTDWDCLTEVTGP